MRFIPAVSRVQVPLSLLERSEKLLGEEVFGLLLFFGGTDVGIFLAGVAVGIVIGVLGVVMWALAASQKKDGR